jgi:hypothetical protein
MHRIRNAAWRTMLAAALLLPVTSGCGDGSAAAPAEDVARAALEAALSAWSRGDRPGEIAGARPPVVAHDTPWGKGRSLDSFEILGESEGAAAERQFIVRLTLSKPEGAEEVVYHVLGVDPLMVFRDEDYRRNINMENGPSLIKTGNRRRRSR